jgi:hypothetical protein
MEDYIQKIQQFSAQLIRAIDELELDVVADNELELVEQMDSANEAEAEEQKTE